MAEIKLTVNELIRLYLARSNLELNTTPLAGANDTQVGANVQNFTFFTMPTTYPLYIPTGIEWLNGTVINGTVNSSIYQVDASPPVSATALLVAYAATVTQSGGSTVQRVSTISGGLLKAGQVYGVQFDSNSATARFGTTTVSSNNNTKAINASIDYTLGNTTAWTATTEEPYIKVYYKGVWGG